MRITHEKSLKFKGFEFSETTKGFDFRSFVASHTLADFCRNLQENHYLVVFLPVNGPKMMAFDVSLSSYAERLSAYYLCHAFYE